MFGSLRKKLNDAWSQADVWDKQENQQQRQAAQTLRQAQPTPPVQTKRNSLVGRNDNQPGFQITNNSLTRGLSRAFDQVNPLDNNRTWQQRTPTPPPSNLDDKRSNISKTFDQVNFLDNNKTFKQSTPTNTESLWSQGVKYAPLGTDVILTRGRQSVDALTGHSEREQDKWLKEVNQGTLSQDQYRQLLNERQKLTCW